MYGKCLLKHNKGKERRRAITPVNLNDDNRPDEYRRQIIPTDEKIRKINIGYCALEHRKY